MKISYSKYIEKEGKSYPNPQFKTLDRAIASGKEVEDVVYYYGSDKEILDLEDYNEYGWEFIVNKYKYNSDFLLNYIPDSSKETIGNKLEDIDKVNRIIFPTLVQNDKVRDNIRYFGSITIGKQKLIMINVSRGYDTLSLFDTTVDSSIPRIIITFSEKEISFDKIVWFIITSGGRDEILDINLSFFSWENSINPHRNMNSYLVRRDEFSNTLANLDIFGNLKKSIEDPLYVDLSSNTIVGNKKVDVFPIGSNFILLDSNGEEKNGIGIVYDESKRLYSMEDFCIGIKTGDTVKLAAKYKSITFTSIKLLDESDIWQGEFAVTSKYVEHLINTYKYPHTFKMVIEKLNSTQYFITEFLESNTTLLNKNGLYLDLSEREENKAELQTRSSNNLREIISIIGNKIDKYQNNLCWDRYTTYRKGQEVTYLNDNWISLEDNNKGNLPSISNLWLKQSMFSDNFRVKRSTSIVKKDDIDQLTPGYVSPSVFTVSKVSTGVEFSISYLNGYKLDSVVNSNGDGVVLGDATPNLSDYATYTSSDLTMKYKVPSNIVNDPGAALIFHFTRIKCPLKVKIHHPTVDIPEKSYDSVKLKDSISLKKINIDTVSTNLVKLVKEYYIGNEKVNSRVLDIPTTYPAEDKGDGSSYIDIDDIADLPGIYYYNIYLEGVYYKISIIDHVGFYVDKSEVIIPKTNTSVNEVYRISPVNGVLEEGIKYNITYLSEGKYHTSDTIVYNPLDSSRINTVNGVVYTMTAVNNGYFNLKINGNRNINGDIKLKIWK